VSAYSNDRGHLRLINKVSSTGDDPCYISTDGKGKNIIAGNYSSGSLALFGTAPDGGLTEAIAVEHHQGSGPDKNRQEAPHVHCTMISPDGRFILATDLGTDKIVSYSFHGRKQSLQPTNFALALKPGSGPRHLSFHPNEKWVYVSQEMSGKVTAMNYKSGQLSAFQEISLLPDSTLHGSSADIHVAPGGKYLYVSNRQPTNTITIFSIDATNGQLTRVGLISSGGKVPRNFSFDASGKWLLVANQESDNIRVFSVDIQSGMLKDTGKDIRVSMPVCLVWGK
jgi:6-phosphogluconolactonase